jgi:hypothetical protein
MRIFLYSWVVSCFCDTFVKKREYKRQVHKKNAQNKEKKEKIRKREKSARISKNTIDLCTSMIHFISILFSYYS